MGILATRLTTPTNVVADGLIPVGTITHRNCPKLNASGNTWTIDGKGYHMIWANVTLRPSAIGEVVVTMRDNGTIVATGSATVAAIDDAVTIPLLAVDYNRCGCASDSITMSVSVASTVDEADVIIEGR